MSLWGPRLGSTIGAVAGLFFVLVNVGGLHGAVAVRVVALVLFATTLVAIARADPGSSVPPPDRSAVRIYWLAVLGEVIALPVGARVLDAVDQPDLVLCWVVLVVGVHFLPFASAFRVPVFRLLAGALIVVALGGTVGVLAGAAGADRVAAVVAGFVLLAFAAYGVLRRPVGSPA